MNAPPRIGTMFHFDWDLLGLQRLAGQCVPEHAGFDLFTFPSNLGLLGFRHARFVRRQVARGRRRGWAGVMSQQEHFGALAAALVAEQLGLPGTAPEAILAAQHKLHARRVLQQVCPEACPRFAELPCAYGDDIPEGLAYPLYVKPVKAAFSVLARRVDTRAQLQAHTRFGRAELWLIRSLVEPFEQVCRERLPQAGSAHRMLLEQPVHAPQFNLDGWVYQGQAHALGVVDAICYPGTQAFMRWEHPSRLAAAVQARALAVAQRFLAATGFTHGLFNMEFFHDARSDRLTVIEFNPRMASQFSDLYLRVRGIDPHAIALALALGRDPLTLPRVAPTAGCAASLVYRSFDPARVPAMPGARQRARLADEFAGSLLYTMPKRGQALARDFKWLGSHRYGIVHLGARHRAELLQHTRRASQLLGWPAPLADLPGEVPDVLASALPAGLTPMETER